jgi:hypothetical protein
MKNDMGRECSMYGRKDRCRQGFNNLKERDRLEEPGVDRRIILKCILKK